MALIGYARVSTSEQETKMQTDALTAAGCVRTYVEKASGTKTDRPELARALDRLEPGDTLVVWKLDRLGRSTSHIIDTVNGLADRGVGFKTLTGFEIDTTSASGKVVLTVFAAFAEFERDQLIERTRAGLEAAKASGKTLGRPVTLTAAQINAVKAMRATGEHSMSEIAAAVGVSRATAYRALVSAS